MARKMTDIDLVSMAKEALQNADIPDEDDDDGDELETQEPEQTTVEAAAEPEVPVKSTVIRDYLRSQLKADLSDDLADEDLAPQIAQVMAERQRLAEENEQLRQFAVAAQRQDRPAPEPPAQPEKKKWDAIRYDPDWEKAAELDPETRQWVPKMKFGAWGIEAANSLNEYSRSQTERARKLTTDPLGALREAGLDDYLAEVRKQIAEELRAEQESALRGFAGASAVDRERAELEKFFDENRKEFFKTDAKGSALTDMNGNYILTAKGELYRDAVAEAKGLGITDQKAMHRYALRLAGTVPAAVPEPTPASPKERDKEQKKKFLERGKKSANRLANREGSVVAARERGEPQNPGLSFRDMVLSDPDNADILGANFQG